MDDAMWHAVLSASCLDVQDVLHCSRACKRSHQLVMGDAMLWISLYERDLGALPAQQQQAFESPVRIAAVVRGQYKDRYISKARERRINRRVQHITLLSAVQATKGRLKLLQQQEAGERHHNQQLHADLRRLEHLRRVQATANEWQLETFKLYANRVAQAVPVEVGWRATNLQHSIKESDLKLQSLQRSIASSKSLLKREQHALDKFELQAA